MSKKKKDDEITLKDITSNKYFYIGLIILFAAIPRFLLININKAAWWDETQYLLMTKHLLTGSPTTGWWEGRSIFYPLILSAISLPVGFNELLVKAVNTLFSLAFIFMTYKLIQELYSERYALIAALIASSQWVFFFYSFRILLGIPSGFFLISSSYFFIKSLRKKKDYKLNLLSGVLLGFAFNTRFTSGILLIVYLAYLIISSNFKYKNYLWIAGFIIGFSVLGIYELVVYGNPFHSALTFLDFNIQSSGGSQQGDQLYYLSTLFFNYGVVMSVLIGLGMIGLVLKANKKNNLFTLLNLGIFLFFYSFITQVKEFRFLIHLLPFFSVVCVIGIMLVYNMFSKNKKYVTLFLIGLSFLIVLENSINGYERLYISANSYEDIRKSGEYLSKLPVDSVVSQSEPQITYYSGKTTYKFPENESAFYALIKEKNIEYVMASSYQEHPSYIDNLDREIFIPVEAYPDPTNAYAIIFYVNRTLLE